MNYNGKVFITDACISLRPNGGVSLQGTDVADVVWDKETIDSSEGVPSNEEIITELNKLQAIEDARSYQRKRASDFPEISEQLDLLYHDMLADKGDKSGAWFAAVKAVKDKYPKE